MDNIDNLITTCLDLGQIHISSYSDGYLCATLDMYDKELYRVFSNNGINHLLLLLEAKTLNSDSLLKEANQLYPHCLAPLSTERNNPLYILATEGSVSIFITKGRVHIEQYVTKMQSLTAKPRPSYRRGAGSNFGEALKKICDNRFYLVTCIPKDPM